MISLELLRSRRCLEFNNDIFIFGKDKEEHDIRLRASLGQIRESGVTLNKDKCEFNKSKILYVGHIVSQNGIQANPERTKAIDEMKPPMVSQDGEPNGKVSWQSCHSH